MAQQFHFWVFIQRKQKYELEKIYAPLYSLQHYFNSQDKKQPMCPSVDEWKKIMWYLY